MIAHTKAPFVLHADGTKSQPGPLSFTRVIQSKRGKHLPSTYFDVLDQTYAEGRITGVKCAAELMDELSRGHGAHLILGRIVKAAVLANAEDFSGASQSGAASAFLSVVQTALKYFADHADHRPYFAQLIANGEKFRDECAQRELLEKSQFVDRMKAGKAKKKGAA